MDNQESRRRTEEMNAYLIAMRMLWEAVKLTGCSMAWVHKDQQMCRNKLNLALCSP